METGRIFLELLYREPPHAVAEIYGNKDNPSIRGLAKFYNTFEEGVLVSIEVMGLPDSPGASCNFFAIHIHEYGNCSDNFNNTGGVLYLNGSTHPYHSGAMPPLMSSGGYAWTAFYDDRINISDILGRSIVIHDMHCYSQAPELADIKNKIACGIITVAR